MKYFHLVYRNLMRKKVRTFFTLGSIFVSFVLFGLLTAFKSAFGLGIDLVGIDRLIMLHKVSIIQPLPAKYEARIEADEGVVEAVHSSWFGGIYQDPKNQFAQMAVNPDEFLDMYPEFLLPEDQKQAWIADRTGAIVGRKTANRFGWQIGDRIPIQGTIWRTPDGSPWEFTIRGIYDGQEKGTDTTQFLFHQEYLAETTGFRGIVGWYIIRINDPDNAPAIAKRIDALFANSEAETNTTTEKAFVQSFANQIGNISKIVSGIVSVVFFILLLVAGNTMANSVRERTSELAVMKTLGFSDRKVMGLVLSESMLLAVLGGGAGLAVVYWLTNTYELGGTFLPILFMPASGLILGISLVLLLGFVTGAIPAFQALRLEIINALRRG